METGYTMSPVIFTLQQGTLKNGDDGTLYVTWVLSLSYRIEREKEYQVIWRETKGLLHGCLLDLKPGVLCRKKGNSHSLTFLCCPPKWPSPLRGLSLTTLQETCE